MIQWLTRDVLDSLLNESVFLNESHEWMIQWLTRDWLVSLLNESVFFNESHECMIQWLTRDVLVSLLNESVFLMNQCFWMNHMNEWFNDSLDIDSFHYWMNQFLWMNEWFKDKRLLIAPFHHLKEVHTGIKIQILQQASDSVIVIDSQP